MRYLLLLLNFMVIGCNPPQPKHKFAIGDCYIDGGRVFIIKEIGQFGYGAIPFFRTRPTFELIFSDENLVHAVDCKFAEENKHE